MPAYSPRPLWQKIGLKPDQVVVIMNTTARPIPGYWENLPFQPLITYDYQNRMDLVHLFVDQPERLTEEVDRLLPDLAKAGSLWVSWPKLSAKTGSPVTEDVIRDRLLPLGLVDVKVCSVTDDLWSGLKLVWRKVLR